MTAPALHQGAPGARPSFFDGRRPPLDVAAPDAPPGQLLRPGAGTRRPVTVIQLEYFVAAAQEANFSRAAERMFISRGTLSAQMSKLEAALGRRVLERCPARVTLTEDGKELLPLAQACLRAIDAVVLTR